MDRLQQMLAQLQAQGGGGGGPAADKPLPDTSEKIQISSLSLLKMLKHGNFFGLSFLDTNADVVLV
jgi:hypothetical protein